MFLTHTIFCLHFSVALGIFKYIIGGVQLLCLSSKCRFEHVGLTTIAIY